MGKKQIRTREPLRLAETVCGWHNPPGARKCEEIPYASIRLMTSHYQWDINAQTKHAPPRLGAPLRYGPRHYMSPQVPWVPFNFLILAGVPFADAHSTACLRAAAPLPRGFEFRSPTARKLFFKFRFIEPFEMNLKSKNNRGFVFVAH